MNVLIVSHTYISPINRDKWTTMTSLNPDINLTVIFPKQWPSCIFSHHANPDEQKNTNRCSFVALDTHREGNELLYTYKISHLYTLIKKLNPDLIHVEQGPGALCYTQIHLCCALLRKKIPTIFFTWVNWEPKLSIKHRLFLAPLEKINLTKASGAIAGNHDALTILQKKGFTKPILVLPQLGINNSIFAPHNNKQKNKFLIGFVGRLTKEKGIFLLAQAFCKIAKNFPSWHLAFIGQGPDKNELLSFIDKNNMQDHIHIKAPVSHMDVADHMHTFDLFVLPSYDTPSWREQFGHVLIEAMACGIPVLASNAGEIPHVIAQAGRIFEQKNEQSLIEHLQTLMQDEDLRKALGESGCQRVQHYYTHEVIAEKTHAFWLSMIK